MAVRNSQISYFAPSFLGEKMLVANWLVSCDGKLRAHRKFQIVGISDGVVLTRAEFNYICIKIDSGKPSRMPDVFRQAYKPNSE